MDDTQTVNQDTNGSDANTQTPASDTQGYSEREKQYYARMKKEEQKAAALEQELAKYKAQPVLSDIEWKERVELASIHGIKDEEELSFVMQNGGKKALDNPMVKAALDKRREQAEAESKVAFSNSAKSSVEKRYSPHEVQTMTADQYEAALAGRKI
jgi:hypothetical protein